MYTPSRRTYPTTTHNPLQHEDGSLCSNRGRIHGLGSSSSAWERLRGRGECKVVVPSASNFPVRYAAPQHGENYPLTPSPSRQSGHRLYWQLLLVSNRNAALLRREPAAAPHCPPSDTGSCSIREKRVAKSGRVGKFPKAAGRYLSRDWGPDPVARASQLIGRDASSLAAA